MLEYIRNWLTPKSPLSMDDELWILKRYNWLYKQFEHDFDTVLPTREFFPCKYDGSDEAIEDMFWRVCENMGIPEHQINLQFCDAGEAGGILLEGDNVAGLYSGGYPCEVMINTHNRTSQTVMVAIIAHELCHVRLMGEQRVTSDVPDNEELTDLATIFFGYGIFTANSKFRTTRKGWASTGYLPTTLISYAIAFRQHTLGEPMPDWLEYLSPSARSVYKRSLKHLDSAVLDDIEPRAFNKYT